MRIVRKIDDLGRVTLPKPFRDALSLNLHDEVSIVLEEKSMRISPKDERLKCSVTGEYSDDVKIYANDLALSQKGAKLLMEVLKNDLCR